MNFFKALFGSDEESPEQKRQADETRKFDIFKYDGVRAAKMGQHEYAVKCYEEALKLRDDLEVRDYLAQALVRIGRTTEAFEQLRHLSEAEPQNKAIFIEMAQVAYLNEDYEAMSDACDCAMNIDSNDATAYYLTAKADIGRGDMIGAIAMLTKAIALKGDYPEATLLRGQTLLKMGDTGGAGTDADELASIYGDNEDVMMLKARVERAKGNIDAAIECYGKVIDANPFCSDAYKERGAVKYDKGDMTGAQADAQKAMEIEPQGMADVSGDYSAEGVEQRTRQAYSNLNPLGL